MGWTGLSRKYHTFEYVLENECACVDKISKLLGRSVVGSVVYSLVELNDGEKLICVDLVRKSKTEWLVKNMDETCGPFYYDCPAYLLKQSTQTSDEAVAWRAACLKKKADAKQMVVLAPQLKRGMVLVHASLGDVIYSCEYIKSKNFFIGVSEDERTYRYKLSDFSIFRIEEAIKNGVIHADTKTN